MSLRKKLLLLLLVLVIGAGLFLAFRPQPIPVSVAEVRRGALQVTVQQEGQTRVRERFVVHAPVSGWLPRLDFDVGDLVSAGQRIAAILPASPTLLDPRSRAQAEAAVAEADAAYRFAVSEMNRLRPLYQRKEISESNWNEAQAAAARAEATLAAARSVLGQPAAVPVEVSANVPVLAPVAGRVLELPRKSAGPVVAGEPLLALGDTNLLEVAVDVLSADAVRLAPGMRVVLERWGGTPLDATVRRIEPVGFTKVSALGVEEQRVWVIVDLAAPAEAWHRLGDGYRVEASFVLWSAEDVLQAPSSAVFRDGDGWAAFVVEGEVAHRRTVMLGHRAGLAVEIAAGLVPGQQVITHPADEVSDGVKVTIRD